MSTPAPPEATTTTRGDRILDAIERIGNRLPEPFMLFIILFLLTGIVSTAMAVAGVTVTVPGDDEPTVIRGLFTGEGLTWLTANLDDNYVGFPPLMTVLPILLAIGIALRSGLLTAVIRLCFGWAPPALLPYVVGFVGVIASIMADSAFVVIPPLAAMVFKAAGRHPLAGLLGGFAAAGAGYSTNIFPTSLDALFAGITTSVMRSLPNFESTPVNPVSNWWFNIASSIVLGFVAGFIIDRVLEPRLKRQGIPTEEIEEEGEARVGAKADAETMRASLSPLEMKGVIITVIVFAALVAINLFAVLHQASPWRSPETGGFLPKSPLLDSIVFIIVAYFIALGAVYGAVTGTIRSTRDAVSMMTEEMKEMLPFVVLAFILGQFVELFNWSGIGSWIAVNGAAGLESIGLTGFSAAVGFMVLSSLLNLFIISGSGMWTIMAAVFVPMFALLGYEPAFTQAAFRVGDSATQIITPMNPYMVVLLAMIRKYEPGAGLGTLMSRMLPFVIPFWIVWAMILAVFFFVDLPLGPGNPIFLED